MVLIDANVMIRIIINDNKDMAQEAAKFISENQVLIRNEVMAEIVYVLQKVYKIDRLEIYKLFRDIIEGAVIKTENHDVVLCAFKAFGEQNLDFVDCLLYAHNSINGNAVFTFDKALKKIIN
ncbi:MAG: PIN domain-containing protein [Defluviitaleaceae bacterium]|nr:PIN domain-containing protein [Defluviitaleaceae bacterium]